MNTQMILSLLKRVLAWIGTRFQSGEVRKPTDLMKADTANSGADSDPESKVEGEEEVEREPLVVLDKPAHPNNYGDRPDGMEISLIVLHYTASGSLDATVRWFQNPEAKVSAHYVIGRDGTIVRMVSEEKKAYHAGKSEWNGQTDVNRFSIGVELVNWGKLVKRGDAFFTWPNDYTNPYHGLEPVFLEDAWWEPYPVSQIVSLRLLLSDLQQRYSIADVVGHRDVSPGRKVDPGPALSL